MINTTPYNVTRYLAHVNVMPEDDGGLIPPKVSVRQLNNS